MAFPTAHRTLGALLGLALSPAIASAAPSPTGAAPDGYLSQKVEILVYAADAGFEDSERGWTLRREISLFEGYLWRYSLRKLSVDSRLDVVHRKLLAGEFRDYGAQFGFLLDRSAAVEADLRARGAADLPLLILYDPPPDRPNRLAGRTFFEGRHSSIPLSSRYFMQDGFYRPLHLVMSHEYLHQIDLAFSRLRHPAEFLDPDGVGQLDYPPCIEPGGGDLSLRTLLRFDRGCGPVDWELLAPSFGTWNPR
jgi:hypothetical protein